MWVHFSERGGRGERGWSFEGERLGVGKVVGWERVETMVDGRERRVSRMCIEDDVEEWNGVCFEASLDSAVGEMPSSSIVIIMLGFTNRQYRALISTACCYSSLLRSREELRYNMEG